MAGVGAISIPLCVSSSPTITKTSILLSNLRFCVPVNYVKQKSQFHQRFNHISPKATASSSSVGRAEHIEEPVTKVKFQTSISPPGCSTSLSLLGTGYRERVFVLFGVKVYAAGLYVHQSVFSKLQAWRGRSATEVQQDKGLFDTFFQAPLEKSLQIVLVRDVDGKSFWEALDESITPRISSHSPADETALYDLRSLFQGRTLTTQTILFLTWLNPDKMLVSASSDGFTSSVDATIEAVNVTSAIFDVYFGDAPVSPSLKTSVAEGLSSALIQKA